MARVSIDPSILEGEKFIGLDDEAAIALWFRALCYCARLANGGTVPAGALKILSFVERPVDMATKLVGAGLWETTQGGFRFVDYDQLQVPSATPPGVPPAISAARCQAGRLGGRASAEARLLKWGAAQRLGTWSKQAYPAVFERDGRACRYCGSGERLAVDHIVPRCQGGGDEVENLVVACGRCNGRKSGRTPEQAGMTLLPIPGGA